MINLSLGEDVAGGDHILGSLGSADSGAECIKEKSYAAVSVFEIDTSIASHFEAVAFNMADANGLTIQHL
jgi:hypothetical protein